MYQLEVAPRITKELLLSKNPAEAYFEFYLGVPVKKGLFCSPSVIRQDHKPTCAFFKDKRGTLYYKDFGGPSFDFIGAVMHIYACTYPQALRIVANDFGIINSQKLEKNVAKIEYSGKILKETEKATIQVEVQDFTEKELAWWATFGISLMTLNKFKVFSIRSVFLNGTYFSSSTEASPIYGYYGGNSALGDELWRLYMPTKRNYRFMSNWEGTHWQGMKQLPKDGNHCILSKSMKDLMVLFEFGFIAIAPTSENILITEGRFNRLQSKYSNIIVFFDNDLAGVKGAHKYKKNYPNSRCVFIKRKYSKDISDLHKKLSRTQFWEVVKEFQEIIDNLEIRVTKHFYIF